MPIAQMMEVSLQPCSPAVMKMKLLSYAAGLRVLKPSPKHNSDEVKWIWSFKMKVQDQCVH